MKTGLDNYKHCYNHLGGPFCRDSPPKYTKEEEEDEEEETRAQDTVDMNCLFCCSAGFPLNPPNKTRDPLSQLAFAEEYVLFPPIGFKGNLSLPGIFYIFSEFLPKWKSGERWSLSTCHDFQKAMTSSPGLDLAPLAFGSFRGS